MLLYCRYVFEKILIILEETMKKTKIICTMGPNTNDRNLIKDLALAGMDIARFNFSHGDHEEQAGRFALIKSVREELNIPIATLLDTKGPEIRTGAVKDDKKVTLVEGQNIYTDDRGRCSGRPGQYGIRCMQESSRTMLLAGRYHTHR